MMKITHTVLMSIALLMFWGCGAAKNPTVADSSATGSSAVDPSSGLIWQADTTVKTNMNWHEAKEYCKDLSMNGHTDWRLPTMMELQKIIDLDCKDKQCIKDNFRGYPTKKIFWSSTDKPDNEEMAWYVRFEPYLNSGFNLKSKNLLYYGDGVNTCCVRGKQ